MKKTRKFLAAIISAAVFASMIPAMVINVAAQAGDINNPIAYQSFEGVTVAPTTSAPTGITKGTNIAYFSVGGLGSGDSVSTSDTIGGLRLTGATSNTQQFGITFTRATDPAVEEEVIYETKVKSSLVTVGETSATGGYGAFMRVLGDGSTFNGIAMNKPIMNNAWVKISDLGVTANTWTYIRAKYNFTQQYLRIYTSADGVTYTPSASRTAFSTNGGAMRYINKIEMQIHGSKTNVNFDMAYFKLFKSDLQLAKDALTLTDLNPIQDFTLPNSGVGGTTISWVSSNTDAITIRVRTLSFILTRQTKPRH